MISTGGSAKAQLLLTLGLLGLHDSPGPTTQSPQLLPPNGLALSGVAHFGKDIKKLMSLQMRDLRDQLVQPLYFRQKDIEAKREEVVRVLKTGSWEDLLPKLGMFSLRQKARRTGKGFTSKM